MNKEQLLKEIELAESELFKSMVKIRELLFYEEYSALAGKIDSMSASMQIDLNVITRDLKELKQYL